MRSANEMAIYRPSTPTLHGYIIQSFMEALWLIFDADQMQMEYLTNGRADISLKRSFQLFRI